MSWQAQTAVNHHSKQTNLQLFRLLMYLAEHADNQGVIDPAPRREKIAEWCGITPRALRKRIKRLIESKELEQTRVGSGPGNPSAYKILLPFQAKGEPKGEQYQFGSEKGEPSVAKGEQFSHKIEERVNNLEIKVNSIESKLEKMFTLLHVMGEQLADLKNERVNFEDRKGEKGEPERVNRLSTESADDPSYDQSFDPKGEEEHPPPQKVNDEIGIEMINALSEATGDEWSPKLHPT